METQITTKSLTALWDKGKLFVKGVVIFVMALLLWIPTHLIMDLVKERETRQKEAIADISDKWAGKQILTAPMLVVPYTDIERNNNGVQSLVKKVLYFQPDQAQVSATVVPEKRYRGIYEVVVYRSAISITGKFAPLVWQQLKIPEQNILWNEAALLFKVEDNQKGINEDVTIKWGDSSHIFNPQASGFSHISDAFTAAIPFSAEEAGKEHSFHMTVSLNGSEQLLFAATARENKLEMRSPWTSPSFTGVKLPDNREVTDTGFIANWKYLNRSVPKVWNNTVYPLGESALGADLVIAVDSYDKTLRSVKYALLCIVLTFAAFFLIETIYKRPLHLVQYGLAGLALVLFYTLLLSVSEYTSFNMAYLLASVATIGLVVWYVGSIMRSSKLAAFISLVLTVVYAYIFSIIQLQDYSLLMGSVGLFLALAIIMFFSRKLQWS